MVMGLVQEGTSKSAGGHGGCLLRLSFCFAPDALHLLPTAPTVQCTHDAYVSITLSIYSVNNSVRHER